MKTYEKYYLLATAHYNLWENQKALQAIEGALRHLPAESRLRESYNLFRSEVLRKIEAGESARH